MVYLDTSFLIRALASGSAEGQKLGQWMRDGQAIRMSSVAWTEFLCGPISREAIEDIIESLGEPTPFYGADSITAANLFNAGGRRRGSLPDCMIAAVALNARAALATSNVADFERFIPLGLTLEAP